MVNLAYGWVPAGAEAEGESASRALSGSAVTHETVSMQLKISSGVSLERISHHISVGSFAVADCEETAPLYNLDS